MSTVFADHESVPEAPFDLEGCSPEDLARPDAIQAGVHVLLLDSSSLLPRAMSAGCGELVGQSTEVCFAQPLGGFWTEESAVALTEALNQSALPLALRAQTITGQHLWVSRFHSDDAIGLLLEPLHPDPASSAVALEQDPALMAMVAGIGRLSGSCAPESLEIEPFAREMADLMRQAIGFERVMVYRFDPDWNGTVIAESRQETVTTSFLGLTFPASDIPAEARRLFQVLSARPTIDVAAEPQPLLYAEGQSPGADLSHCSYRAVAPVHREYLANMGVRSSLTLTLTLNGRLWGLLACHQLSSPRQLDPLQLALLRSLSEIFSIALARVMQQQEHALLNELNRLAQTFQRTISTSSELEFQTSVIEPLQQRLQPLLGCHSLAYRDGSTLYRSAGAPNAKAIGRIEEFFLRWRSAHGRSVLVTSQLQAYALNLAAKEAQRAAGVVVVVDPQSGSRLLLFRRAGKKPRSWAGDPDRRVVQPPGSNRLDPRSSFELYWREHSGDADPWPVAMEAAASGMLHALSQAHWIYRSRQHTRDLEASRREALQAKEATTHAAMHDHLTGLANRRHLYQQIDAHIRNAKGSTDPVALLHLDLDGFKGVNDSLGHEVGDQLLIRIAEILKTSIRERDLAVRLGGDEFVVFTTQAHDPQILESLAKRLITRISRNHMVCDQLCRVGVSIGIARGVPEDRQGSKLLRQSDLALYESKRLGKGTFSFYTPALDARVRKELRLLSDLREALEGQRADNRLIVYYQPQFEVSSGRLLGAEALLRWQHPELGLLAPDQFLAVASRGGILGDVDVQAMYLIDAFYQRIVEQGIQLKKLAINVSSAQISSAGFVERVEALAIPHDVLTLELLESIYLDRPSPQLLATLEALQLRGIRIELDDFGTGHTSVLSLMAVKPNGLKVDKGLVIPAITCPDTVRLLRLVVGMGHALEIDVTAEGVETAAHVDLVKQLRCQRMQGFGLSKPLPEEAFIALASSQSSEALPQAA